MRPRLRIGPRASSGTGWRGLSLPISWAAWSVLVVTFLVEGAGFPAEPLLPDRAPERPPAAAAAEAVRRAVSGERIDVAVAVLDRWSGLTGSNFVAVVEAVVGVDPTLAPAVVARAVALQQTNAPAVAAAGARKAPGYAALIVTAACTNAPAQFDQIAIRVDRAAPGSHHSILFALGQAIPGLSPYLERAKTLVQQGARYRPSVAVLMHEVREMIETEGRGKAGLVLESFVVP